MRNHVHVIMISEVKPKIHKRTLTPIEYKIEGYDMVMKNLEESTGRGLCTYVNKDLEYKEINLKANFDEYIAIEVKLNDSEEILLVNIPGGGTRPENWWGCAAGRWKLDPKRSRKKLNLGPKRSIFVKIGSFCTPKDSFAVCGWEKYPKKIVLDPAKVKKGGQNRGTYVSPIT